MQDITIEEYAGLVLLHLARIFPEFWYETADSIYYSSSKDECVIAVSSDCHAFSFMKIICYVDPCLISPCRISVCVGVGPLSRQRQNSFHFRSSRLVDCDPWVDVSGTDVETVMAKIQARMRNGSTRLGKWMRYSNTQYQIERTRQKMAENNVDLSAFK